MSRPGVPRSRVSSVCEGGFCEEGLLSVCWGRGAGCRSGVMGAEGSLSLSCEGPNGGEGKLGAVLVKWGRASGTNCCSPEER